MYTIIFAGGLGTRLYEETKIKPKGKPVFQTEATPQDSDIILLP